MILNTKGNEIVRSFLGNTKDAEGNEYVVKLVSYRDSVARTEAHGEIYSAAFIEDRKGEIMFTMLFTDILTQEEMDRQADYMIKNVDKILEDKNNG